MSATVTRIRAHHITAPAAPVPALANDNRLPANDNNTFALNVMIFAVKAYMIVMLGLITCIAVLCFIMLSPLLALHYLLTRRDVREYLWFLVVIGGSIALLQFLEIATGHAS